MKKYLYLAIILTIFGAPSAIAEDEGAAGDSDSVTISLLSDDALKDMATEAQDPDKCADVTQEMIDTYVQDSAATAKAVEEVVKSYKDAGSSDPLLDKIEKEFLYSPTTGQKKYEEAYMTDKAKRLKEEGANYSSCTEAYSAPVDPQTQKGGLAAHYTAHKADLIQTKADLETLRANMGSADAGASASGDADADLSAARSDNARARTDNEAARIDADTARVDADTARIDQ
jgi:hypothetical protein